MQDGPSGEVVRAVPAPGLAEVAEIWWDREVIPVVTWEDGARRFVLVNPHDKVDTSLLLLELAEPADDPEAVARVLADGLASCDFPPTEDRASPPRVAAALRVAGRPERPLGS